MTDIFSTREIVTGVWVVVNLAGLLCRRDLRLSMFGIVRAPFHWKIAVPILLLALYVTGAVWGLHRVGFWTVDLAKDTVLWFLFVGRGLPSLPAGVITAARRRRCGELRADV